MRYTLFWLFLCVVLLLLFGLLFGPEIVGAYLTRPWA